MKARRNVMKAMNWINQVKSWVNSQVKYHSSLGTLGKDSLGIQVGLHIRKFVKYVSMSEFDGLWGQLKDGVVQLRTEEWLCLQALELDERRLGIILGGSNPLK